MNSITMEIIEFFKYLNTRFDTFVTQIEVKPIQIQKDLYISGFKRIGLTQIEAHIKRIKTTTIIKNNKQEIEIVLKDTPEEEMFINTELLTMEIIRKTFNELRNNFYTIKNFEIANIQYKLKTETDNCAIQEETIIYQNKKQACKEIIAKRKLCTTFKSHFIHYGTTTTQTITTTVTDEQFAEMPL